MEKIDIIKRVEAMLPNEIMTIQIDIDNSSIPLQQYLEERFINHITEYSDPIELTERIETNLGALVDSNRKKIARVDEFITGNPLFIDVIQISKDEVFSAKEWLRDYCLKNMDEEGQINYVGKKISIEELYKKLLDNQYHEPTIEEKAELCDDMTRYIDIEILDSIVDGMDISVRDYISKILPTKMSSITTVVINGESLEISDLVQQIVDHQAKMIEDQKREEREKLENIHNRINSNVLGVGEIQVRKESDNSLTITTEIPVVTSSLLNDEEKIDMINHYEEIEKITANEYFNEELNDIKLTIDNTNTAHDLDAKETFFRTIVNQMSFESMPNQLQELILSIDNLITLRRNNIIKVNGNGEDYVDVLFNEINIMKDEVDKATTLDEFSTIYGEALDKYRDVLKKGIKDNQLRNDFKQLFKHIREKRLILDATIGYQSPEVERVKVELNTLVTDIKQDILKIEHDSNNLGNMAGTIVRVDSNIQRTRIAVEKAYMDGYLTEDDREYYMNRLKGYQIAIESEQKIGYGLN